MLPQAKARYVNNFLGGPDAVWQEIEKRKRRKGAKKVTLKIFASTLHALGWQGSSGGDSPALNHLAVMLDTDGSGSINAEEWRALACFRPRATDPRLRSVKQKAAKRLEDPSAFQEMALLAAA